MDKTTALNSVAGAFVDNDDSTATVGTLGIAFDKNAIQDEIVNAISGAGLTPTAGDNTQLLAAINALIAAATSGLPVGATYTQYPNKASPITLAFPGTWTHISSEFPGSFLRVEGGLASAFNSGVQPFATADHNHFKILAAQPDGAGNGTPQSSQSGETIRASSGGLMSSGNPAAETIPDNETIRIWERTA